MQTKISKSITVAGLSLSETTAITSQHAEVQDVALAAAKAGTLSAVSTGATTGTITAASGSHGIQTGDAIDIYWTGGKRLGVTVGTVSGTAIPLTSSGSGDTLPAQGTVVTFMKRTQVTLKMVGTNAVGLFFNTAINETATVELIDGSGEVVTKTFNGVWAWYGGNGETNPATGHTLTGAKLSHSSAAAANVRVVILTND